MKKLLYSLLLFASASLFAQKNSSIKFAVANDIVGTIDMFNAKKNVIQSMNVYKVSSLPQNLKKYSYIADNGITEFKIKNGFEGSFDRISLASLNEQFKLPKETPVLIEGYEFPNTDTVVYGDILAKMEVKDYNGKKTLFISTQR